jgi:hypothetical protein
LPARCGFGEDTKEYDRGRVSSTEGSWLAGEHGALPGVIMPARPQVGERYRQEFYQWHAEDQAQVISRDDRAKVPAGSYDAVLVTEETTPLEPTVLERKYYARGIGMVLTVDVNAGGIRDELISIDDRTLGRPNRAVWSGAAHSGHVPGIRSVPRAVSLNAGEPSAATATSAVIAPAAPGSDCHRSRAAPARRAAGRSRRRPETPG